MKMDPAGQQVNDTGTAGVIVRPPLIFLAALLLGFVLDRMLPLPFVFLGIDLVNWIIGGSLILIGLALAAAGIRNFSRAGTPVRATSARAASTAISKGLGSMVKSTSPVFTVWPSVKWIFTSSPETRARTSTRRTASN